MQAQTIESGSGKARSSCYWVAAAWLASVTIAFASGVWAGAYLKGSDAGPPEARIRPGPRNGEEPPPSLAALLDQLRKRKHDLLGARGRLEHKAKETRIAINIIEARGGPGSMEARRLADQHQQIEDALARVKVAMEEAIDLEVKLEKAVNGAGKGPVDPPDLQLWMDVRKWLLRQEMTSPPSESIHKAHLAPNTGARG